MTLQDILDQLAFGELSQISLGGGADGVIDVSNYKRILPHINLGLMALYRRFPLKEGRLKVEIKPGRYTYPLNSDFAVNKRRSREAVRYLVDTEDDPFKDDILKISTVQTVPSAADVLPMDFPLNDRENPWSIMTPSQLILRLPKNLVDRFEVPPELETAELQLVYQASHPLIVEDPDLGELVPSEVEVELPYSHLEALLLFVASRVHNPIGMTNEFHAGNSYAAKFEMACKQLEFDNVGVDQGSQGYRLHRKGWA